MRRIDDNLDLSLLRTFDALVREEHVTRAARRLDMTQSAVSHALGRLRRVMGDPLFVRGPRGVVPTERARALAAEVRDVLARVDALTAPPGPLVPATLERTFTLAGADYMELLFLPKLLQRVTKEAPRVDLASRPLITDPDVALESGELDVAIGVQGGSSPRLLRRKLFDETFVCMLRRGHPALRRPLTIERYAALPHVLISPRGSGGGVVDAALARHRLQRRIAVRTATFLAAPLVVAQSDCIVTLPRRIAAVMARGRPVTLVPPPLEVDGFTISMFFHERSRSDPAHAWLRERIGQIGDRIAAEERSSADGSARR